MLRHRIENFSKNQRNFFDLNGQHRPNRHQLLLLHPQVCNKISVNLHRISSYLNFILEFELFNNVMLGDKRIEYIKLPAKNRATSLFMCDNLPGNVASGFYTLPIPENQLENDFFMSLLTDGDFDSKGKDLKILIII